MLAEPIGRGGMGAVWRADDVELERDDRAMPWMVLALITDQRGERAKAIDYAKRVIASTSDADTIDSGEAGEARARMHDKLRARGSGSARRRRTCSTT